MKITRKMISILLALVMVLGLLPATAFATGAEQDVVYLSISLDTGYIDDKNGNPIAYVPVSLSKIEAIDLAEYGWTICFLMLTAMAIMKPPHCSC